jgi:lysophospholipase
MTLFAIPENPVPPGAVSGFITTPDGAELRVARFPVEGPARGTVCVLHGRTECIEKYFEAVEELRGRGFAVATFDWRGQGGSVRLLRRALSGHIEDFEHYLVDVDAFMRQVVEPDCPRPHFALAHSMGGTVALAAALAEPSYFARMVLTAPMLRIAVTRLSTATLGRLCGLLEFFGIGELPAGRAGRPIELGPFAGNPLTSDPRRFARMGAILRAAPELTLGSPTISWLHAAARAMRRLGEPDALAGLKVPVLFVAAGADRIVSTAAIEALARRVRLGACITIPGASHEILQERDRIREQFWAAFDAFITDTAAEAALPVSEGPVGSTALGSTALGSTILGSTA